MYTLERVTDEMLMDEPCITDCGPVDDCGPDDACEPDDK